MVGAIVFSPTDAASQEPVVGSAQRVVVARARAPRDAAVQHCVEYLQTPFCIKIPFTCIIKNSMAKIVSKFYIAYIAGNTGLCRRPSGLVGKLHIC